MNRAQRRAAGHRGPGVWTQTARCIDCGQTILHVEHGDGSPGDRPSGLPPHMRCPDCDGELVAPRRNDGRDSTFSEVFGPL
jgi:uncharacterized protein with PIN domain